MTGLVQDWEKIAMASEDRFAGIDRRHLQFVGALTDTTIPARQNQVRQDTSLGLQLSRLQGTYESTKRRHLYHLKEMRTFLDATKVWLQRINAEGKARRLVRRSWQSRKGTFISLFVRIQHSESEFGDLSPYYARIAQLLPGMKVFFPSNP
ncbi:MAG: hypothetical protein RLZZ165_833 [Bacteroidota bacterium]|jgi:hypothetical protein